MAYTPATTNTTHPVGNVQYQTIIPLDTQGANPRDMIIDTQKETFGYFTNGVGLQTVFGTGSGKTGTANDDYYFDVIQTALPTDAAAATQFSVTYGHYEGSGSNNHSGTEYSPTEAIYGQFASLLLAENEVTGNFKIANTGTNIPAAAAAFDPGIYVISFKRDLYKHRLNKGTWTLKLSGSSVAAGGAGEAHSAFTLTDDSATVAPTSTIKGPRYNIKSGSAGTLATVGTKPSIFGHFYPDAGLMVFSEEALKTVIPGTNQGTGSNSLVVNYDSASQRGFNTPDQSAVNEKRALRMVNCIKHGSSFLLRGEEDVTSVHYFCRIGAGEMNGTTNPTAYSGSYNEVRHKSMRGNMKVYITGLHLYNASGDLVANAKLSKPLAKDRTTESTIKVKIKF